MIEFETGYFASEDGQIYSSKGKNGSIRAILGKVRKNGYREVLITVNGARKYLLVHRVIAGAFIKNPENKRTVNHKDLNKLNNSVSNLEWMTDSENLIHARDLGALNYCKINMDIARKIRAENGSQSNIAKKYGIAKTQVGYIKQNKRWKEL